MRSIDPNVTTALRNLGPDTFVQSKIMQSGEKFLGNETQSHALFFIANGSVEDFSTISNVNSELFLYANSNYLFLL